MPLLVIAPAVAVAPSVPLMVDDPMSMALASTSVTLLAVVILMVPKLLPVAVRVMSFAAPAASVVLPEPVMVLNTLCVMAPLTVNPMSPLPTAELPGPTFSAPAVGEFIKAPWFIVLKVTLETTISIALLLPVAPIVPVLAFKLRLFAVIVRLVVLASVKEPAFKLTVLVPKSTAPPIVIVPELAAESPITIEPAPVTPPARAVISVVPRSNADAPANDIVVAALNGFTVSCPVV